MEIINNRWTEWEREIHEQQMRLLNEFKIAHLTGDLNRQAQLKVALQDLNRKKIQGLTERGRSVVKHFLDSIKKGAA